MRSEYSLPGGSMGKKIITFGVDMSSSVHIDDNKKDILILGKGPTQATQVLDDATLIAEAQYSINFSRSNRKYCLTSHYNGSNVFLFVNTTKMYQIKVNDSEIKKNILCVYEIFQRISPLI